MSVRSFDIFCKTLSVTKLKWFGDKGSLCLELYNLSSKQEFLNQLFHNFFFLGFVRIIRIHQHYKKEAYLQAFGIEIVISIISYCIQSWKYVLLERHDLRCYYLLDFKRHGRHTKFNHHQGLNSLNNL